MFVAENEFGKRIYATEFISKEECYFCPVCKGIVKLRAGSVNMPHFAHISLEQCQDDFASDMSEWHREWQMLFPEKNREVIITHNGETHRADILCYGTVIEFQHSPISETEFWRRNEFYTEAGYRVVWIFDVIDIYSGFGTDERLSCIGDWDNAWGNGAKYKWKYPWRFLGGFIPQDEKKIDIFIQIVPVGDDPKGEDADCCLERVTWVNPYCKTIWSYFHTSYEVMNYSELLDWLIKNRTKNG